MTLSTAGFTQVATTALQTGDVIRYPDTMIAFEEERAGTFQVVRIWRWDHLSFQIRLREVNSGRELSEVVGSLIKFWRRV